VCAAVWLLAGCSADADGSSGGRAASPDRPATAAGASASPTAQTPEEEFDGLVEQTSFYFEGQGTGTPSQAMRRYCELLDEKELDGVSPAQWLADKELAKEDAQVVLGAGVKQFCPRHAATLKAAVEGSFDRWFTDGTYEVGGGAGRMPAGTYRTTGALRDCYWERTSRSGEVLDNQFATSAQEVRVTVRAGDGQFTTRHCGSWKPVP
jgi:hypothetical protein